MKIKMKEPEVAEKLIHSYSNLLLEHISGKFPSGPRTFGFEYEFLPQAPIDLTMMEQLYDFLPRNGFHWRKDGFRNDFGLGITFEPGGQIEYSSMPLLQEDTGYFEQALENIAANNMDIEKALGIKYVATGYIPGRKDSPLCLDSERYISLHDRMSFSGTRGREMMKGTASIHLHVVVRSLKELVPVFLKLSRMSRSNDFKMGRHRRNIWDNTDPCRCGFPYEGIDTNSSPYDLINELVTVAVYADILGKDVPFWKAADKSFDKFLYHFTTVFTDIRLNNKGPTFELRTPDSVPGEDFKLLWKRFIQSLKINRLSN